MKSETYENIQGVGSLIAFVFSGVAVPFTLEYAGVMDTLGGQDVAVVGLIALVAWAVIAVAFAIKVAVAWSEYAWYYRQELAQKLHRLADKVATH